VNYLTRLSISLFAWLAVCALAVLCTAGIAQAAPACIPGFKGPTTEHPARFVNGANGLHVYWWCPDAQGKPLENGLSCGKYGGCALGAARFMASNFDAGVGGLWDANVTWVCTPDKAQENSDDGRLCFERLNIAAAHAAVWFPAPIWKVKPNGTSTTRPAYALANGVVGTKEAGRAPVGAVCDVNRPTAPATGGDVRAEFGQPGLVTICTKGV
jgi:hypothetical protein